MLADILINVFVARGHVFGSFLKAHFRVVYPINIKEMSGPENAPFLGELYDHVFGPFLDLYGTTFFVVPEKIFVRGGQKFARFWPFLAKIWIFGTPPKSGIFRKISLRFHRSLGGKKVPLPPF